MQPAYIIAEAGVNHNGSEAHAMELIDIAAKAGADAIKFQLFKPELLVTATAATAEYQARNLNDTRISQRQMLEKLTLPEGALVRLEAHCREKHIDFLCTPFDHESLGYLVKNTKMRYLKLPSGEVANGPLLLAAARTGLPIILSTGMADMQEIGVALGILYFGYTHKDGIPAALDQPTPDMLAYLRSKVTLLHCVSQYPAPREATNLRAMDSMRDMFGLPTGLSDHTEGVDVALMAVARGAFVIEKHFTYDKNADGPDHKASLTPGELKALVEANGKAAVSADEAVLGSPLKRCQPVEESTRDIARKSVVAAAAIAQGEIFSERNLTCKRPATGGVAPNYLWSLLGKNSTRGYSVDDFIDSTELSR